ncbi:MAG TPA: response regulator [bacterium]|nr:response regulator [bacterium]
MNPLSILLIDPDPKNVRILRNNFLDLQFDVDTAANDSEALEKITARSFDAILSEVSAPGIDGYALLEQAQQSPLNRSCSVIFLTQKSDVWNRVKSFKLGAKDYIIKPIHVREIVMRVQMVLKRQERYRQLLKRSRSQFSGRLADLGAVELIEVFGAERKSGVLTLNNENGVSGRIVFKEGAVIRASAGLQRSEEAVLKMLSWKKGRFTMVFAPVDGTDEIGVSNMGLLLQGAKRMEQREELLHRLPALETVLVTTQNFKKIIAKKELASDLEYFVRLFDGAHSLGRIIDESKYDEITTLNRILKLYELGFLHSLRDFEPADELGETSRAVEQAPEMAGQAGVLPSSGLEHVEKAIGSETTEELLHEQIDGSSPEAEPLPAGEETPLFVEEPGVLQPLAPDSSAWNSDSSFDKDLFYDLRRAEEEGQDLFAGSRSLEGGSVFSDLDRVIPHHPADALLEIGAEEELAEAPPSEPVPEEEEGADEVRELEQHVRIQEKFRSAHGSILILGNNRELCRQMIANLAIDAVQEKSALQPADSDLILGTAEFKGGHLLNLIALSLEREFAPVIDFFAGSLLGFIFLIDGRSVDWGYQRYLRQVLREKTSLPAIIVFSYNEYLKKPLEVQTIRQRLGLRERDGLQLVSDFSVVNSRRIIFRLFETFYRPQARRDARTKTIQTTS